MNKNKKTSIKNKWSGLSSLTKILIGACVGIILASSAGVVIGGAATSWKFGNHNATNKNAAMNLIPSSVIPIPKLTSEQVTTDINDYLKKTPWYDKIWLNDTTGTNTVKFDLTKFGSDSKSGAWKVILTPENNLRTTVTGTLTWTTKENDSDILSIIDKTQKYSKTPPNLPSEKFIWTDFTRTTESDIYNKYNAKITGLSNSIMYVSNKPISSSATMLNGTFNYITSLGMTQYIVYLNLSNYTFNDKTGNSGVKMSDFPTASSDEKDAFALDAPDLAKHALVFYTASPADTSIPLIRLKNDDLLTNLSTGTNCVVFAKTSTNHLIIYAFQYKILSEDFKYFKSSEVGFNPSLYFS